MKGQGEPLVLIHGVYAGASSYEYRRVFDLLTRNHRVFAFDLLGFGRSAHPSLVYMPVLYEQLIADFVREVVGGADHPAAVIASTLSAAFTIRAAAERPALFSRLALIEPTGMESLARAEDSLARRAGWRCCDRRWSGRRSTTSSPRSRASATSSRGRPTPIRAW